ncbi:MAG: ATP-binding protein [Gammaproteobacteria bacterium]|nr:ATP-binding protein [Gammaproteobacteria bacterium]
MLTNKSAKQRTSKPATEQARIRNIIRLGFASVLGLTFCLGVLGLYQLHNSKSSLINIVELGNEKISLAIKMRDAIRLRALTVQRMLATDDYFRRDEELQQYYEHSGVYRIAQQALLTMQMTAEEKQIHETLRSLASIAQPINDEAAEMLMQDPLPAEFNSALEKAVLTQRQLLQLLDQFVDLQKSYGKASVTAAQEEFQSTIFLMLMVVVLLLLAGSAIAKRVTHLVTSKNSELEAKNKELEAAWFEAANATHAKSKFLANMSHEIRTPLTSIIGFAETLAEPSQNQDDLRHAAEAIKQSGRHLSQIINDVLDISKIEVGQVEMEMIPVSPTAIVSEVANMVEEKIKKKGLKFRANYYFPLPKLIEIDPTRLRQILLNLLGNAAKFTNEGIICINTYYLADERMMKYEVSDTGIGMTPQGAAKVFEPFSQAEKSTTRRFGGTGLGLSISKQLAEKMGGDIVCESRKGEGSTFTATISIGDIHYPDLIYEADELSRIPVNQAVSTRPQRTLFSGRVLLAEDTIENQKLISLHLHKSGVEVTLADDGEQAVNAALQNNYDLILMDMQMPVLSGAEATRTLRDAGYTGPIVVLTANTGQADRMECMDAGANDFLSKPIDFDRFFAMLKTYLVEASLPATSRLRQAGEQPGAVFSEDSELQELYNSFLRRLPEMIESIKDAAQQQNWQELTHVSHQLKGLGGSFGYHHLTAVCKNIHDCARQQSNEKLDEFIAELQDEYRLIQHGDMTTRKAV